MKTSGHGGETLSEVAARNAAIESKPTSVMRAELLDKDIPLPADEALTSLAGATSMIG